MLKSLPPPEVGYSDPVPGALSWSKSGPSVKWYLVPAALRERIPSEIRWVRYSGATLVGADGHGKIIYAATEPR